MIEIGILQDIEKNSIGHQAIFNKIGAQLIWFASF